MSPTRAGGQIDTHILYFCRGSIHTACPSIPNRDNNPMSHKVITFPLTYRNPYMWAHIHGYPQTLTDWFIHLDRAEGLHLGRTVSQLQILSLKLCYLSSGSHLVHALGLACLLSLGNPSIASERESERERKLEEGTNRFSSVSPSWLD